MIINKDITKKKGRDIVSIEILTEDKGVLENIASNNGLEIHEIIGLLMDGFLDN